MSTGDDIKLPEGFVLSPMQYRGWHELRFNSKLKASVDAAVKSILEARPGWQGVNYRDGRPYDVSVDPQCDDMVVRFIDTVRVKELSK